MLTCYFLGEDAAPYSPLLDRPGWKIESFEHSKSVLEVVPKLKLADCIFCDLGAIFSAEMLLQLDLALALKKEFCFVVAKTNIQRIPRKGELKSHHVIVMDTPITGESVPKKILKQVQKRLEWIEIIVRRKRYAIIWKVTLPLLTISILFYLFCNPFRANNYIGFQCCLCTLEHKNNARRDYEGGCWFKTNP